jgi:hypothetical protein
MGLKKHIEENCRASYQCQYHSIYDGLLHNKIEIRRSSPNTQRIEAILINPITFNPIPIAHCPRLMVAIAQ